MVQALVGFDVNVARNLDALLDALMGTRCGGHVTCQSFASACTQQHLVDSGLMGLGCRHHGQDRVKHAVKRSNHCPEALTSRDLLMAYRWPTAVVLSSLDSDGHGRQAFESAHPHRD